MSWSRWVRVGERTLADLLIHCPNGGHRHAAVAAKLKAMGVKPGIPDLQLPVPVPGYAGGWWELKVGRNKPTDEQLRWHETLRGLGHYVAVHWEWTEAAADILRYLAIGQIQVVAPPGPIR